MELLRTFLSEQMIERIGWVLIHFLWQGIAVMSLMWCVSKMLRKASSNMRYIAACAGLVLMVAAPVATYSMLDNTAIAIGEPVTEPMVSITTDSDPVSTRTIVVAPAESAPLPKASLLETITTRLETALPYCVIGWAVGVAVLSVWYLGGWCQLQKLRRIGTKAVSQAVADKTSQLANRLGVKRAIHIAESALVQVPTVIGWLKPLILLPATALTGLDEMQLKAMIAHELAHIKRCDYLINIAQTVVEILGFYHPAVWWMSRQIRTERENCCDDIAVALLEDRKEYAKALFSMETIRSKQHDLAVAANGGHLQSRISRLAGKPTNQKSGWIPSVAAILLIATFMIPAAMALKTDSVNVETKDLISLTAVKPSEMTVEQLADICGAIESSIIDITVDYQWYNDPPVKKEDITGTGLLTTVDREERFWATMRPFSEFSLTSMSANFTDGANNNFHSTTKQSFNGKIGKHLQIVKRPDKVTSNPDGTITKSRRFMEAESLNPSTFSIFHFYKDGPLSKLLKIKELEVELNNDTVMLNGFDTIAVEISRMHNQRKMLIYRIYFAVDHNYTPIRFEHTNGRKVVYAVDVDELQEVSKGLWYPESGRLGSTDGESSNIYKASKIVVNQGLTLDYFDLVFPAGTKVIDERYNKEPVVEPTKEKQEDNRIESMNNLKQLGLACQLFAVVHDGQYPKKLDDIHPYIESDERFEWLNENVALRFPLNPIEAVDLSGTLVAYDKALLKTDDGTSLLFADGHVEFVKKENLKGVIGKASQLDIINIELEPVAQGKNVLYATVKNTSDTEQLFGVHIYTRSVDYGPQGVGWGTRFFEGLKPNETKGTRFVYKIQGPITDNTYIRVKLYNPASEEEYDYEKPFAVHMYKSGDLTKREPSKELKPVLDDQFEEISKALRTVQNHIRKKEYEKAWGLFSGDYKKAEYATRGIERFKQQMEPEHALHSAFAWEKDDFLKLVPVKAYEKNGSVQMHAACDSIMWTVDFIKEESVWKTDWIAGYRPKVLDMQEDDVLNDKIIVPGQRIGKFTFGMTKDQVLQSLGKPNLVFFRRATVHTRSTASPSNCWA